MILSRRTVVASTLAIGLAAAGAACAQNEVPTIAAAADLRDAVEEIAAAFRADTGDEVLVSFGSTGNFARQIREGAPFQVFMAADEDYILDLTHDGFMRDEGTLYAEGRVAIAIPKVGSSLRADGTLQDLRVALGNARVTRFAIANPEHAPYGVRAREALQHAGLWEALQPALVLGENVSQAAQFALSGNADGGIIAWSLALSPRLREQGDFALIPAAFHEPLLQRMALARDAGAVAEAFYAYVQKPAARQIMARYGFIVPE